METTTTAAEPARSGVAGHVRCPADGAGEPGLVGRHQERPLHRGDQEEQAHQTPLQAVRLRLQGAKGFQAASERGPRENVQSVPKPGDKAVTIPHRERYT